LLEQIRKMKTDFISLEYVQIDEHSIDKAIEHQRKEKTMETGDRVGAISHADDTTVYLFGYGTYQGDEIPPKGTIGAFGLDMGELGRKNPKILLDNGKVVWGCQCWWGPEEKVKKAIGNRKVQIINN
jgi:hypothetical protein